MKNENLALRGLIFVSIGLILSFLLTRVLPLEAAFLSFCVGICLVSFGIVDESSFLLRNRRELLKLRHKRMQAANKGIVWVWVVALAGICVYAISFYVLLYPALEIIGVAEGMVSWDADSTFTLNLVKTVLNWHPILFIVGLIIWAFVNSQRREDVTYPAY